MNVLITGASGFLGGEVKRVLGADHTIDTLGRHPGMTYQVDLASEDLSIEKKYDVVIHAAGKAHSVPKTEQEIKEFYEVNAEGTANLLSALKLMPKAFVLISTVAVYGREQGELISELEPLNGATPYAQSKRRAEQYVKEWAEKQAVSALILRLPLVAGKNPPGNLGSMIKGIRKGYYFRIGGGKSRRSVVMAKDVARCIRDNIGASGTFNLTDGYHPQFLELETLIANQLGKKVPRSIPSGIANFLGRMGDLIPFSPVNTDKIIKMTSDLTFDDSLARKKLNWEPSKVIDHFQISKS